MVVIDGVCEWVGKNNADPSKLRLYLGGQLLDHCPKADGRERVVQKAIRG